jgi:hypothetical protein
MVGDRQGGTKMRIRVSASLLAALALTYPAASQSGPTRSRVAAVRLTPAVLLGRWGDNGDCSKDVIFRGDGTFRSYNGGEGSWRLAGERLTMTGDSGQFVLIVRLIDRNRLRILNPDGSIGFSQRC